MANIKLKDKFGKEQIYNNVTEIKIPTENGTLQTFSEGEPATILNNFTEEVIKLSGKYDGSTLNVVKSGLFNVESLLNDKKLPLNIDVNITKPNTDGVFKIIDTNLLDVSSYSEAVVIADDLISENIKSGVTILGTTGTFESEESVFDSTHSDYESSLQAKLDYSKSASYLFSGASSLSDLSWLSGLNFSEVTNFEKAFLNCSSLTAFPQLNLASGKSFSEMFYNCTSLTSTPKFMLNSATNLSEFFYNCSNLVTVSDIEAPNATNTSLMFYGCKNLKTISALQLSEKLINVNQMFCNCNNLEGSIKISSPNLSDLSYMFKNCYKLESVELGTTGSSSFPLDSTFQNCYSLKSVTFKNIEVSSDLGFPKGFFYGDKGQIPSDPLSQSRDTFLNCPHFNGTIDPVYNPEGLRDGVIRVPEYWIKYLKDSEISDEWSYFADQIVGFNDVQRIDPIKVFNKPQTKEVTINLYRFNSIPKVSIKSLDPRIVKVSSVLARKKYITFNLDFTGKIGSAQILVDVDGDQKDSYTFEASLESYTGPTYRVEDIEGAQYNFQLNRAGYYQSTNPLGVSDKLSVCKLVVNNTTAADITLELDCIYYATRYAWGTLSKIDTLLDIVEDDNTMDTAEESHIMFGRGYANAKTVPWPQRVTYTIPTGEHFIYIKYVLNHRYTEFLDDSLQFKVVNLVDEQYCN